VVKRNPRTRSKFDDFLKEEGILEEVRAKALKRALAEQLEESMQAAKVTKLDMAKKMATVLSQLDRVLDPGTASKQGAHARRAADSNALKGLGQSGFACAPRRSKLPGLCRGPMVVSVTSAVQRRIQRRRGLFLP
jgi:antitoxin HicB